MRTLDPSGGLDRLCIDVGRSPRKCLSLIAYGSAIFFALGALDMAGDTDGEWTQFNLFMHLLTMNAHHPPRLCNCVVGPIRGVPVRDLPPHRDQRIQGPDIDTQRALQGEECQYFW